MDFLMDFSKLQSLGCRHKLLGKEPKVSFSKGDSAQFFVARIQDLIFFATDPAERQQALVRVGDSSVCDHSALEMLAGYRHAPCRGLKSSRHLATQAIFRKSRRFLSGG